MIPGSLTEISPHSYFFCKKFDVSHMRRRASPVAEISVSATEISGVRDENFLI